MSCGDNTKILTAIKFHLEIFLKNNDIKPTNHHKAKILVEGLKVDENTIQQLNLKIKQLRENYCDFLWASFKGVNQTGHFRKRLNFKTIKKIIQSI